jgi:hypothetical protein
MAPMIELLLVLVLVGVGLYLVNTYVPMAPPMKTIVNVVAVLVVIVWLLDGFGLLQGFGSGWHGRWR